MYDDDAKREYQRLLQRWYSRDTLVEYPEDDEDKED